MDDIEEIEVETIFNGNFSDVEREISVMLIGRLENPKIECQRELNHCDTACNVIPLGVKKNISQQKFRIPFKNLSGTLEADYDFTFVKTQPSPGADVEDRDLTDLTHLFEFYCQPGNLKFNAAQQ